MNLIDYDQKVNECNRALDETQHEPPCTGTCERVSLTALEVDLHNEVARWTEAGMLIQGVPRALAGAVPGIAVEILETDMMLAALIDLLDVDREELTIKYKEILLQRITKLREESEAQEALSGIVLPNPGLFVPGKDDGHMH